MEATTPATVETRVIERPFGPFERMLALRYLGTKREYGGLAFISVVSVIGITLGVLALIVVMSVMNGFRLELISKIIGFEPHAFIDTRGMTKPQVDALIEEVRMKPGVISVEPTLDSMGLATFYERSAGAEIRGVLPEDLRANGLVAKSIADGAKYKAQLLTNPNTPPPRGPLGDGTLDTFGTLPDGSLPTQIVLGDALAYDLGITVGDRIKLTSVSGNGPSTIAGRAPRTVSYQVTAIYHVGNERFDRIVVFMPMEAAKSLVGYDEGYPIVGVRLSNPDAANDFVNKLMSEGKPYTQSWIDRNGTYVTALIVERNVMRLILFIVVIITALNIITGVLMLVKNKARDVAILRTIGATRGGVVRVFMMTGTILGMAGVGTGVLLGILIVTFIAPIQHFLEGLLHMKLFPPDIYQLDALPAKLEWADVGTVAGAAFVVTLLMSVIPSLWAARLNPVEALRFE